MKKIISLIILFLIISLKTFAQDVVKLSLEEARQYALNYNKILKNSDLDIEKSKKAITEAFAGLYPQIRAKADYSNFLGTSASIQLSEFMPPQKIEFNPTSNLELTVGQMIFNCQYWVGVKTAKLVKGITELGKQKAVLDVVSQVYNNYNLVLISKELLERMNINKKNIEDLYEKTKSLVKVGIMETTEIDQLSVQLNSLINMVKQSERQLELSKNMLKLQLGVSPEKEIELSTTLDDIMDNLNPEKYLNKAFSVEQNIDMQIIEQQYIIQKKAVDLKRASRLPTLNAFYRYSKKLLKPKFDMSPEHVIGFQLDIPIFSGFKTNAQVQQAKIELMKTQNSKSLLSDQLKTQEKQLLFNFNNALETYVNQKQNLEIAKRVYDNLKNKYNQGIISGLDLINADNNYVKAETDLISAKLNLLSSKIELDKLYRNMK